MQAIIPVSKCTGTTICHSSCIVFLDECPLLLVASFWFNFSFQRATMSTTNKNHQSIRVNHWFVTWQCLVASGWPETVWIRCVCVCTCESTRGKVWACQVAGFRVIEFFFFLNPESQVSLRLLPLLVSLTNICHQSEGWQYILHVSVLSNRALRYIFIPFKTQCSPLVRSEIVGFFPPYWLSVGAGKFQYSSVFWVTVGQHFQHVFPLLLFLKSGITQSVFMNERCEVFVLKEQQEE